MITIKCATVFKMIDMPDIDVLRGNATELEHSPITPAQICSAGFTETRPGELIQALAGGFMARVRIDEKKIPGSAVSETAEKLAKDEGVTKPNRSQRLIYREMAFSELARVAPATHKYVNVFFHEESQYLIVASTNENDLSRVARLITTAAGGSIKTQTLNLAAERGLTQRLKLHLSREAGAFDPFCARSIATLQCKAIKSTVSYRLVDEEQLSESIVNMIDSGFSVIKLALSHDPTGLQLMLNNRFRLPSIRFPEAESETEEEMHEDELIAAQIHLLVDAINDLVKIFDERTDPHGDNNQDGE